DAATGTADVLLSLIKDDRVAKGQGIDMAARMLDIGRAKIQKRGLSHKITLTHADANKIPFENNHFDVATISFGIRNMEDPTAVLQELCRTLKPEGRALILEFSMPKNPILRAGHLFYLRTIVPLIGYIFSGHYKAYKYLNQTIEDFPYGDDFCRLMTTAGFHNVKANPLLWGVATIYQGDKPTS
ncbi:MAG: ubiquinone/menaquinone biosynthesis methyltransferase, partial [Candidatus Omnitrophica bacterium]|nr:ubiquinone/menaquinone biosynthesis methyltransferase [Candidatus Omnitrophota bacterium]